VSLFFKADKMGSIVMDKKERGLTKYGYKIRIILTRFPING
jgi:hypothetical protein